MKKNVKLALITLLVALSCGMAVFLWLQRGAADKPEATAPQTGARRGAPTQASAGTPDLREPDGKAQSPTGRRARAPGPPSAARAGGAVAATAQRRTETQQEVITEERLKLLEEWEDYVDELSESEAVPTAKQAAAFKRAFLKLDREDRLDGIQTALNLMADDQFALFYPILFDKTMDPDILDEIFSDGLNHDEEIKVPMMLAIYKDKEHPMYEEAWRILDATGELEEAEEEE